MLMYLQTSRLRLQNNENAAAQVLLYALCKAGEASAMCCCWLEHHTTAPTTGLKQIWSQLTILTTLATTTTHKSDQALKPTVESCCALWRKLFYSLSCVFITDNTASSKTGGINSVLFLNMLWQKYTRQFIQTQGNSIKMGFGSQITTVWTAFDWLNFNVKHIPATHWNKVVMLIIVTIVVTQL